MNLAFLQTKTSTSTDNKVYNIYRAQISLVITGYSNRRWVAYAFLNNTFDDDDDFDDETYGNLFEGFQGDPIASDGLVDANNPIWNPREYFALIFECRLTGVLTEWENLVRWVERSIQGYVRSHFSHLFPTIHLNDSGLLTILTREINIHFLYRKNSGEPKETDRKM
jgi:hypothetical protein